MSLLSLLYFGIFNILINCLNGFDCLENCLLCSQADTCLQCQSSNYIAVASQSSLGCLPCKIGCLTCDNQMSQCKSCAPRYYQSGKQCKKCSDENCIECEQQFPQQCLTCDTGFYLDQINSICYNCNKYPNALTCRQNVILSCESGYYVFNGQSCQPCSQNCLSCSSSSYCFICQNGYYGSNCLPCHKSCKTCINSLACLTCSDSLYIVNGLCQRCLDINCVKCGLTGICQQCSSSYYLNNNKQCQVIGTENILVHCQSYIEDQSVTSIYCQRCSNNHFVKYLSEQQTSGICDKCSLLCKKCNNFYQSSKCEECLDEISYQIADNICYPKSIIQETNQKISYLNSWNNPKYFRISQNQDDKYYGDVNQCLNNQYGGQAFIQLGLLPAYQFVFQIKLGIAFQNFDTDSKQIIAGFNSKQYTYNIEMTANNNYQITSEIEDNINKATKCSLNNFQYTQILQISSSKLQISGSQLLENNLITISAPTEENIFFNIHQTVVKYYPCHDSCKKCNRNQCVSCYQQNYFIQNQYCIQKCSQFYFLQESLVDGQFSQCLQRCPVGTYHSNDAEYWFCQSCPLQCTRCESPTKCSACSQNYFLMQNKCLDTCPDRFFPNNISNRCEPCLSPCYTCLSQSHCKSCQYNFLFNGTCVGIWGCPSNFFADIKTLSCQRCSDPCFQCQYESNKCKRCSSGYLFENKCLQQCPSGYVMSNNLQKGNICQKCQYPCNNCANITNNCLDCLEGFLLDGQCYQNCPQGYIQIYQVMKCVECKSPCKTCFIKNTQCSTCIQGYIYHQNLHQCLLPQDCIIDSFKLFSGGMICINCPQQCSKCTSWQNCSQCKQGYYLFQSRCYQVCPLGYFESRQNKLCQKCAQQCQHCKYQYDYCLSCSVNYALNHQHYCILGCQQNQLYPSCQACSFPCYSCEQSKNRCTSCVVNYYLDPISHKCLSQCLEGFFQKNIIGQKGGKCQSCKYPCQRCVSQLKCTKCLQNSNLYLFLQDQQQRSGICLDQCPQYYYLENKTLVCQPCVQPCLQCKSLNQCTSCLNGILDGPNCVGKNQCPYGRYAQLSLEVCLDCPSQCLNCQDQITCVSCSNGYYLQKFQCVQNCPIKKYKSMQTLTCQQCSFPCQTCQISPQNCLSCSQPQCQNKEISCISYYFYQNQCLLQCPSITYPKIQTQQCMSCISPCKTCQSQNICTSCIENYYFLNALCYEQCPDGYYQDNQIMQCIKCIYPCKYCINRNQCTSCIQGLKVQSICLMSDTCPDGNYLVYDKHLGSLCSNCSSQCKTCQNFDDFCTSCKYQGKFLYDGSCLSTCPTSYYGNLLNNQLICHRCPIECLTCKNTTYCTQCQSQYLLQNNACVQKCMFGYYSSQNEYCQKCSQQCKTCVHTATTCLSCHINNDTASYFYKFQCLSECPLRTYPDNASRICRQCIFPCQNCLNSQVCDKCYKGYYLSIAGICLQECKSPHLVDSTGHLCVQKCEESQYTIQKQIYVSQQRSYTQKRCQNQCHLPYILSIVNGDQCLISCKSDYKHVYVSQNLICSQKPTNLQNSAITNAFFTVYLDANYSLIAKLSFSHEIQYDIADLESSLVLSVINSYQYSKKLDLIKNNTQSSDRRRLLTTDPILNVNFQIIEQKSNYIIIRINPRMFRYVDFQSANILQLKFRQNSNLYIRSKVSRIPLQQSQYITTISQNSYQPYNELYSLQSNYKIIESYRVFGMILVGFLLVTGLSLFMYNWYAKIYESLHLLQLMFLLSALQLKYPPNLYYFFQGFRNAHFYLIGNWFRSQGSQVIESNGKMQALFGGNNFILISGHIICFLFILCIISLILYLCKYLPERTKYIHNQTKQQKQSFQITYPVVRQSLINKFKLIKWSHIHDFIMSITMVIFFGATAQMNNYNSESVIQILGIIFSWICMCVILAYYGYMGHKLYRIVQLSINDPQRFCDKNYLFRDNMLSITESAIHPSELYLNYIRAIRILIFGTVIGLLNHFPMFCLSFIIVVLVCSSVIYLFLKPYPDDIQNKLLGLADVFTWIGLILMAVIQSKQFNPNDDQLNSYIQTKWSIGLLTIAIFICAIFSLFVELIVSIIRGNDGPQTLQAQQIEKTHEKQKSAPKKIKVIEKVQFDGWSCEQGSGMYFAKYDQKDQIMG